MTMTTTNTTPKTPTKTISCLIHQLLPLVYDLNLTNSMITYTTITAITIAETINVTTTTTLLSFATTSTKTKMTTTI